MFSPGSPPLTGPPKTKAGSILSTWKLFACLIFTASFAFFTLLYFSPAPSFVFKNFRKTGNSPVESPPHRFLDYPEEKKEKRRNPPESIIHDIHIEYDAGQLPAKGANVDVFYNDTKQTDSFKTNDSGDLNIPHHEKTAALFVWTEYGCKAIIHPSFPLTIRLNRRHSLEVQLINLNPELFLDSDVYCQLRPAISQNDDIILPSLRKLLQKQRIKVDRTVFTIPVFWQKESVLSLFAVKRNDNSILFLGMAHYTPPESRISIDAGWNSFSRKLDSSCKINIFLPTRLIGNFIFDLINKSRDRREIPFSMRRETQKKATKKAGNKKIVLFYKGIFPGRYDLKVRLDMKISYYLRNILIPPGFSEHTYSLFPTATLRVSASGMHYVDIIKHPVTFALYNQNHRLCASASLHDIQTPSASFKALLPGRYYLHVYASQEFLSSQLYLVDLPPKSHRSIETRLFPGSKVYFSLPSSFFGFSPAKAGIIPSWIRIIKVDGDFQISKSIPIFKGTWNFWYVLPHGIYDVFWGPPNRFIKRFFLGKKDSELHVRLR